MRLEELVRMAQGGTIVLDWNGTTVNDTHRSMSTLNPLLEPHGLGPLGPSEFSEAFCLPLSAMLTNIGVPEQHQATVIDLWNDAILDTPAPLGTGVEVLLRERHRLGRPVGVVSAAFQSSLEADATSLGIREWLAFIVGDAHPKSEPIRRVVASEGGPVLYVGDTEYDMLEAIEAGAVPVGVSGGYRPAQALREAGAVIVLDDLSVLLG